MITTTNGHPSTVDLLRAWESLSHALAHLLPSGAFLTGHDVTLTWTRHYPEELGEVPASALQGLEILIDRALIDARARGNTPRAPIAEDGKRGAACPKR